MKPKAPPTLPLMRWFILCGILGIWSLSAFATRLKDLAALKGARGNQLTGYGLVAGLSSTGDKSGELTSASLAQVLKGFGVDQKPSGLETKNIASVLVTANLPPFTRAGTALDVTLSSIGSATSLDGGMLLMTSLRGPDGKVYAIAQGKTVITRHDAGGGKAVIASLVTAEVPKGAILEREVASDWTSLKDLRYQLFSPDFTTAARIARRLNEELAGRYATAIDAGSVQLILPYGFEGSTVDLIAQIEAVDVEVDSRAKVLINPRTGTVILGERVRVLPVAIAHGNLRLEVKDPAAVTVAPVPVTGPVTAANAVQRSPAAAGPAEPLALPIRGAAAVPPPPAVAAAVTGGALGSAVPAAAAPPVLGNDPRKGKSLMSLKGGTSISDVVAGLNDMGANADDLVSLLRSLQSSGALLADLEIQ